HRHARGAHRGRIDVGEAKRVAEAVGEKREADEAGPGAPFEQSALRRHPAAAKQAKEILSEARAPTVKKLLIIDVDVTVAHAAVRPQPAPERFEPIPLHVDDRSRQSGEHAPMAHTSRAGRRPSIGLRSGKYHSEPVAPMRENPPNEKRNYTEPS